MFGNEERERLENTCRRLLRQAAEYSDSGRESVYKAYDYARARMEGMAQALVDIYAFELLALVRNYENAAETKVWQALGINPW